MPLMHGSTLAGEVRLPALLPTAVVSYQRHGPPNLVTLRVNPEVTQQQQAMRCRGPGLSVVVGIVVVIRTVVGIGMVDLRGKVCASRPLAVFPLQGQQPGTPPVGRHPPPLCRHDLSRRACKITQRLPSYRGIRIEQPVQDGHALRLMALDQVPRDELPAHSRADHQGTMRYTVDLGRCRASQPLSSGHLGAVALQ